MRRHIVFALAVLLLGATVARAEEVIEAWRSAFGEVRSVSVNQSDGSCWVAAGLSVMHLSSDGAILSQLELDGLTAPECVSVNSMDGSCWVADGISRQVVHLAEDGAELWRGGDFAFVGPTSSCLSVNPADGSCWVGTSYWEDSSHRGEVVRLAEDGKEMLRVGGLQWVSTVSVNPADGSCWVAHAEGPFLTGEAEVVHLAEDGTELWRGGDFVHPFALSANPEDGSCWVSDTSAGEVIHLAQDGGELLRVGGFDPISSLSVNPADASCWVAHFIGLFSPGEVVHLAEDGAVLARAEDVLAPVSMSVNPADNSCWVVDAKRRAVVHLAEDGAGLWSGSGFSCPDTLLANPADGSCWVADIEAQSVTHVDVDGAALWQEGGFQEPRLMGLYPANGSCWVRERGYNTDVMVHLAEDGMQLLRVEGQRRFATLALDCADGSWWACEYDLDPRSDTSEVQIVHFAHDGTELLRRGGLRWDVSSAERPTMSANPLDGSCWIGYRSTDVGGPYGVYHIAEDGEVLLHLEGFDVLGGPSVNPVDGSCWMTQSHYDHVTRTWRGEVVRLAQDGTELLRLGDFGRLSALSVVPADGSCWVSDAHFLPEDVDYDHEIVHLAQNGDELARVPGPRANSDEWTFPRLWTDPVDGSCWAHLTHSLSGYEYRDELVYLAGDGTEIWRGAPFEHLSHLSLNPADGSCWVADGKAGQVIHLVVRGPGRFPDVRSSFWAYDGIGKCVTAGIVSGYGDGLYHPEWPITRDQMAVYIARGLAGGEENIPPGGQARSFLDVPREHWAFDHIEYCVRNGVVAGYGSQLYHPDRPVTRDQMAVYVARALVAPEGEAGLADYVPADPRNFPDVASDFWAYKHVEYCVENGVVTGYLDGLYHPEIVVTRDQMAVYVARAFGLM